MIPISRIVHFEIPAEKPEKVADFHKQVLGWTSSKWTGPVDYWLVMTGPRDQPGIGWQAHFRDLEGNTIGILENDPAAQ